MKKTLSHLKKHYYIYTFIILIIIMFSLCFVIGQKMNNYKNSMDSKNLDYLTLTTINSNVPADYYDFQLTTLYNFYNKLGYDLNNIAFNKTRNQLLNNMQSDIELVTYLEQYLEKNNIENKNKKTLEDNLKMLTEKSDIYITYKNYIDILFQEVFYHVLSTEKIDIEAEKTKIKQELQISDEAKINDVLQYVIKEKIYDIIYDKIIQ